MRSSMESPQQLKEGKNEVLLQVIAWIMLFGKRSQTWVIGNGVVWMRGSGGYMGICTLLSPLLLT